MIDKKEANAMNYSKPEVKSLGNAETLIQIVNQVKHHTQFGDGTPLQPRNLPAYDLDE